jgi:hypothetical protein
VHAVHHRAVVNLQHHKCKKKRHTLNAVRWANGTQKTLWHLNIHSRGVSYSSTSSLATACLQCYMFATNHVRRPAHVATRPAVVGWHDLLAPPITSVGVTALVPPQVADTDVGLRIGGAQIARKVVALPCDTKKKRVRKPRRVTSATGRDRPHDSR